MNICMLSELFYPYNLGGAERRFIEVAKRLAKKHDVTVYALRLFGQPSREIWENVSIVRVGLPHPLHKRSLMQMLSYKTPLLRSVNSSYDIIHANQGMASFAGCLSFIKKPVIATFHDIFWRDWPKYFKFPFSYTGKCYELIWSKLKYDRIIANSMQTREKLMRLGFHAPVSVIYSGIDLKRIEAIRPVKSNGAVYVGRLVGYKNIDRLIEVFNATGDELKIIGSGPEEARLKKMANRNIKFLGYLPEDEKIAHVKGAQLLINPSETEGLGLVLLEAMACGTPVMARDLPCYREFCTPENAVLSEITEKNVSSLMDSNRRLSKLSINGMKTAKQFDWDIVTEKIQKIHEEALDG